MDVRGGRGGGGEGRWPLLKHGVPNGAHPPHGHSKRVTVRVILWAVLESRWNRKTFRLRPNWKTVLDGGDEKRGGGHGICGEKAGWTQW